MPRKPTRTELGIGAAAALLGVAVAIALYNTAVKINQTLSNFTLHGKESLWGK